MATFDDAFLDLVIRGKAEADPVTLAKAIVAERAASSEVGRKAANLTGELSLERRRIGAYRKFVTDLKSGSIPLRERALAKRLEEIDKKFWTAADLKLLLREAKKLAKQHGLPEPKLG